MLKGAYRRKHPAHWHQTEVDVINEGNASRRGVSLKRGEDWYCLVRLSNLCLAQNAVELCATDRADALGHTATRIRDLDLAFEGTLLFALYAVSARVIFKLSYIFLGHGDPPIAASTRQDARVLPELSVRTG